jgi:hypothetical protein
MSELISVSENKQYLKDKEEQAPKNLQGIGFGGYLGILTLLVFAIFVDILGVISTIIDLGTVGIVGWILRIVFSIIYAIYFFWFWVESNKFDQHFLADRKLIKENLQKLKKYTKRGIYLTRSILGLSLVAKWLPVIGAIIDVLPLETLLVVFLFFIYPRFINRSTS